MVPPKKETLPFTTHLHLHRHRRCYYHITQYNRLYLACHTKSNYPIIKNPFLMTTTTMMMIINMVDDDGDENDSGRQNILVFRSPWIMIVGVLLHYVFMHGGDGYGVIIMKPKIFKASKATRMKKIAFVYNHRHQAHLPFLPLFFFFPSLLILIILFPLHTLHIPYLLWISLLENALIM